MTDLPDTAQGPLSSADRFARGLGLRLVALEQGRAVVELATRPDHCSDLGKVHGGVLFSLADAALAAASNSRTGEMAVAITGITPVREFDAADG